MLHVEVIRPVPELLRALAARHGGRTALTDRTGGTAYADLADRTAALAGHLRALGVRDGDVVLVLLPNGIPLVETLLAATRAQAVAACVSAASTADDVAFALADCRPRVVVTDEEHTPLFPDLPVVRPDDVLSPGPVPDSLPLDDPAFLLYTSGTTGRPKGVLLTQRGMLWVVAAAWLPTLSLTAADRLLVPLPLSHSYPLDLTLAALTVGAQVHLPERFSAGATGAMLAAGQVTVLAGVPTTFAYLLETPFPGPPSGLRLCVSAGALLPAALRGRIEKRLGVPVVDAYGATETSTAIALTSPTRPAPPGSCGLPPPGVACRVVDATGADLPPGAEGELIVRGPGVMLGYHERPAETAAALRDGWYRTGDLARQDRNAFLTITGRVKDLIIRGGENIAPAEIEDIAIGHPGVADCAVAARPDRLLGEVPVLYAVARSAIDPDDLLAWCRDRLPRFKVPAAAYVVAAIPRTASGKVRRHLLAPPVPIEEHS